MAEQLLWIFQRGVLIYIKAFLAAWARLGGMRILRQGGVR